MVGLLLPLLASAACLLQEPSATTAETAERLRVVRWSDSHRPDSARDLRALLAEAGLDADVIPAGRAGLKVEQQEARLHRDVLAADPHLVVLDFRAAEEADPQAAGMLLSEFYKRVVFEIHETGGHVIFIGPALGPEGPSAEMSPVDVATAIGVEMAVRWFGEPSASNLAGAVEQIQLLHQHGKLPARAKRTPALAPEPPLNLLRDELLLTLPSGLMLAGAVPGSGDFRLAADLVLKEFNHTAASLQFDGGHLGFDGKDGSLFLEGPAFGGGPFFAPNPIQAGVPFRLVMERVAGDIQFRIDGRLVAAVRREDSIEQLAFRPHRGELEVRGAWLSGAELEAVDQPMEAGYTIPLLDLAEDTQRQVVVDREPGQYLGHPTTFLHEDGSTMLAVYPKGHGKGQIVYKRSEDGGMSWSERLPVPESWATSQEVPTLYRTEDADGVKRLIMFSGLAPIRMAVSEDDGLQWSELEAIGDYGGIVAMASCAQAGEPGRYLAWFHDDGRFIGDAYRPKGGGQFHLYQVESTDGGLTWGAPRSIVSHRLAHLCEPGFVRSPDGSRLALLLRENSRVFNSFVIFSDDDGRSWGEPIQLPAALTGDRHTAKYAQDGRLVVTFRDTTRDSPTQGDWVVWVGTWLDIIRGTEGQYRVRLMDNKHRWDCAYPGLEVLPDGSFVATTYGHWTEGEEPWIASVRFTLAELDALLP